VCACFVFYSILRRLHSRVHVPFNGCTVSCVLFNSIRFDSVDPREL
jgi:hypothetical protein